jgi:hypothetical protein
MNKSYRYIPEEEVKIINGVFKGIYGYIEQIEMSSNEKTLVHIRVNRDNVVKVNSNEIEFLYDDYLIYKRRYMGDPKVREIIGKFRIRKDNVEDFLIQKYNNEKDFNHYHYYGVCAIPMDKVEFKFGDKTLTIEEVKKIIN